MSPLLDTVVVFPPLQGETIFTTDGLEGASLTYRVRGGQIEEEILETRSLPRDRYLSDEIPFEQVRVGWRPIGLTGTIRLHGTAHDLEATFADGHLVVAASLSAEANDDYCDCPSCDPPLGDPGGETSLPEDPETPLPSPQESPEEAGPRTAPPSPSEPGAS